MNQLETMYRELDELDRTLGRVDAEMTKLRPTVMQYRNAVDRHQLVKEPTKTLRRYQELYDERAAAAYKLNPIRARIAEQEQAAKRLMRQIDDLDRDIVHLNALDYSGNERMQIRRKEELAICERRRANYVASLNIIGKPRGLEMLVLEEVV